MELGLVAQFYQLAIWSIVAGCVVLGDRATVRICLALAISSIFAITATETDNQWVMALALPWAAVVAATGRTMAALAVTVLYGVRILMFALPTLNWTWLQSIFTEARVWEANIWLVSLQMLLAGGAITGGLAAHSTSSNFVTNIFRKYDQIANRAI